MICAWQAYKNLLPTWMRESIDKLGKNTLLELRLRVGSPPELILLKGSFWLDKPVREEDLKFCVNVASRYSPWASATVAKGYITAPGGHRLGLCGDAVMSEGKMTGLRNITSINLRVARDFPGIAQGLRKHIGSVLIIGKPGSGKTTLLRDTIRQRSNEFPGCVAVVDEREEIFPKAENNMCFSVGKHTDVISGCSKKEGIEAVLRSMGPDTIAVDEITADSDCRALMHAGWCGVKLLATAHAGSRQDLLNRPVYRPLIESGLFESLIVLHDDKTWHYERMKL